MDTFWNCSSFLAESTHFTLAWCFNAHEGTQVSHRPVVVIIHHSSDLQQPCKADTFLRECFQMAMNISLLHPLVVLGPTPAEETIFIFVLLSGKAGHRPPWLLGGIRVRDGWCHRCGQEKSDKPVSSLQVYWSGVDILKSTTAIWSHLFLSNRLAMVVVLFFNDIWDIWSETVCSSSFFTYVTYLLLLFAKCSWF